MSGRTPAASPYDSPYDVGQVQPLLALVVDASAIVPVVVVALQRSAGRWVGAACGSTGSRWQHHARGRAHAAPRSDRALPACMTPCMHGAHWMRFTGTAGAMHSLPCAPQQQ